MKELSDDESRMSVSNLRVIKRYRAWRWRNSLTSEVVTLGGQRFRVTRQRGKIVGIETWVMTRDTNDAYGYTVWKSVP